MSHECRKTLARQFVRACRRSLWRNKVSDSSGQHLTGGRLLTASLALSRYLARHVLGTEDELVGILLPPSVGGILANTSLSLLRRVTVNLNYTLSEERLNGCIRNSQLRHVLTSRRFLKKRPLKIDAELVYLEDVQARLSLSDRLAAAVMAYALPVGWLEYCFGLNAIRPDDLCTVIYTSGTTGDPKGVMLSHRNISANVDAVQKLFLFRETDVVLGVLPFFHSFGFTLTLWTALTLPIQGVYHFDPLDCHTVGRLCQRERISILAGTPTFLKYYLRRCTTEQFATLRLAVVGGERLPLELARAFHQKFGLWLIEGYGTTELAPLALGNVSESASRSERPDPIKLGTVGRPIEGVEVRVVDRESGADLPTGHDGMLLVRGPNVMLGYLGNPEATARVLREGWYVTGDIARMDQDRLVTITDRSSRFSKIGGEIVPHAAIEAALEKIVGSGDAEGVSVAVTAVPDADQGERVVVIHKPLSKTIPNILDELSAAGLPNLWIPRRDSFVEVAEIPSLSLGKIDLGQVQKLALTRFASPSGNPALITGGSNSES